MAGPGGTRVGNRCLTSYSISLPVDTRSWDGQSCGQGQESSERELGELTVGQAGQRKSSGRTWETEKGLLGEGQNKQ